MQEADRLRLLHMRDAAREAVSFATGASRSDLENNRMLTLAILKDLETIGEAAARIPQAVRSRLPSIPWNDIVGMRNRLIHTYFDVDLDVVWETVAGDLPLLIQLLDEALGSAPEETR